MCSFCRSCASRLSSRTLLTLHARLSDQLKKLCKLHSESKHNIAIEFSCISKELNYRNVSKTNINEKKKSKPQIKQFLRETHYYRCTHRHRCATAEL